MFWAFSHSTFFGIRGLVRVNAGDGLGDGFTCVYIGAGDEKTLDQNKQQYGNGPRAVRKINGWLPHFVFR